MNNYIRTKVSPQYKDSNFIPIKAEINELDLSIDITFIESSSIGDCCKANRFKLELPKKEKPSGDLLKPCYDCDNSGWDMPECKECNAANDFKYFERKKDTK